MIKVYAERGFFSDVVNIFVVRETDVGRAVLRMGDDGYGEWTDIPPRDAVFADETVRPTLVLPGEGGRALLETLVRYYDGTEDTRQLRKDYDAERKRVDEQVKVIADIARVLAGRSE